MSVIAAVSETGAAMPRDGAVVGAPVEIDIATAREFEREAMRVLDASDGRVVIDLSATTFMDVSGARVIARVTRRARELGGSVSLAGVGVAARRLLDLVQPTWTSLLEDQDDLAFEEVHPSRTPHCDGPPGGSVGAAPGLKSLIVVNGVAFGGASTAGARTRHHS